MIPLLVSPQDWQMLDSNTETLSTRYAVQDPCLGLYSRYSALAADGRGAWFCASTSLGQVVGLSTARLYGDGGCQVDGFTHRNRLESWKALIRAASDWGAGRNASPIWATVSVEGDEKRSLFESVGFRNAGRGEPFDLGGRQVAGLRFQLV